MVLIVPVVKIAYNAYLCCIGRPYGKIGARGAKHLQLFIAKQLVQAVMRAGLEVLNVFTRKNRIVPNGLCAVNKMYLLILFLHVGSFWQAVK
jgi:hypothetical protein